MGVIVSIGLYYINILQSKPSFREKLPLDLVRPKYG